jgi:hypothetical protein
MSLRSRRRCCRLFRLGLVGDLVLQRVGGRSVEQKRLTVRSLNRPKEHAYPISDPDYLATGTYTYTNTDRIQDCRARNRLRIEPQLRRNSRRRPWRGCRSRAHHRRGLVPVADPPSKPATARVGEHGPRDRAEGIPRRFGTGISWYGRTGISGCGARWDIPGCGRAAGA